MSPEGLLTRSRPQRGNLTRLQGGPHAKTMQRQQEALSETVQMCSEACSQLYSQTAIPPPLGLALLCRAAAPQSEGPRGSWGYSLRYSTEPEGLRCEGALGMQRPRGAWSSDGA